MKTRTSWILMGSLAFTVLVGGAAMLLAQSAKPDPPSSPKVTADQQTQLNRLAQLDEQLRKDRMALHATINEYGWESEQADDAREKLVSDRAEYRKLRRSLMASGVPVPPPSGFAAGGPDNRPGPGAGRGSRGHHGCHYCPNCGN